MAPLLNQLTARLDEHYWLPVYGRAATWHPCIRGTTHEPSSALVRKDIPCWPLYTEAHITVDGRLSACSLDHAPRFHMADLNAVCFADAWHSPAFRSLREAHLRGDVGATPCAQCVGYTDADY
jgi:hypothetical protein